MSHVGKVLVLQYPAQCAKLHGWSGLGMSAYSGRCRQARDALGHTALETAVSLGAIPDVELFMLLSG